jgi:hypothetical protein
MVCLTVALPEVDCATAEFTISKTLSSKVKLNHFVNILFLYSTQLIIIFTLAFGRARPDGVY